MTADEPVEGRRRVTSWDDENACHGAHMVQPGHWTMGPHHFADCHAYMPPPVPVESREQPTEGHVGGDACPVCLIENRVLRTTIRELRAEVADHDKRWQQRADLITRTSELRHRAAALEAEAEAMPARYLEALEAVTAERDRARDLAAHLEEDSERLREQLEAVRALAEEANEPAVPSFASKSQTARIAFRQGWRAHAAAIYEPGKEGN